MNVEHTISVCTVKSLKRWKNPGIVQTVEKLFWETISLITMWKSIKNDAPLETCKDCDHKFWKSDDLERHVKTVHDRVKKVTSKAGFGTFVRQEKVKVPKQFLCSECSKTFNSSANLKRHMWRLKEAAAKLTWQISHWKNCVICMCGTVVSDAMPLEVQLINWIMKSKLVYISLSPSVELCKKKHSFKKQNFKENRQFDTWNVWHGRLIIFKCQIVTFLKVEARDSVYPRSLLVSKLWEL